MNLYVMRHGTTVWNEKKIIQGRSSNMLSKTGKCGVEKTAQAYKNTKFDIIICSPLKRTMQTANIMNKYHNVKIFKDESITEVDQGDFTKRKSSSLTKDECEQKLSRSKEYHMENYTEVYNRVKNFLQTLKQKYPYQNVLVVTHNCNASDIDFMLRYNFPPAYDYSKFIPFSNAELRKYIF